ncbi:MAG: hypothetical protein IKK27_09750 [Alistipes sp.]|nr:hypothetical protein [Alistipes sp.]MBR3794196.1 hypothetical protein [Alistipes sp.]
MAEKSNKRAKYGGRVKGTPNKTTTKTKELIADILTEYSNSGRMSDDFDCLEPKDRLMVAERLMQYVMPKIQSVAVDLSGGDKKITIETQLRELSEEEQ